jgi:hypothetical protein
MPSKLNFGWIKSKKTGDLRTMTVRKVVGGIRSGSTRKLIAVESVGRVEVV